MFSIGLTKFFVGASNQTLGIQFPKSRFIKRKRPAKGIMRKQRGLPIPFLVLILAGMMSAFSVFADRGSRADRTGENPLRLQTVEQERTAALYFRILSWLSTVTRRPAEPVKADPQPSPAQQPTQAMRPRTCQVRFEFCAFHSRQDLAANKPQARTF